jgi:hypothetical protein
MGQLGTTYVNVATQKVGIRYCSSGEAVSVARRVLEVRTLLDEKV